MLEDCGSATPSNEWANVTQAANILAETTTVKQGTTALKFDKTGTAAAGCTIRKRLQFPVDVQSLLDRWPTATVRWWVYHANFTNVSSVTVRFVYRLNLSDAQSVSETFTLSSPFSAAAWNKGEVSLASPSGTTGAMNRALRSCLVALELTVTMAAAANTISSLIWDALEIVPGASDGGGGRQSVLIAGNYRVPFDPVDVWKRGVEEDRVVNDCPTACETIFWGRHQALEFGWKQLRDVYRAASKVPTREETMRRLAQYMAATHGWGIASPAGELIDTTVATANTAGDTSIVVASATDFAFLGLTSTLEAAYADLRFGPNPNRKYEFARAIGYSGTTVYLDRPLSQAYSVGDPIRSAGYYPSMAKLGEFPLVESEQGVSFMVKARETA